MSNIRIAQHYFEDAQDYLKRYRVLFYSKEYDFQGIRSRRVKCYIDLRLALEAVLKSAISLQSCENDDVLLGKLKKLGHGIEALHPNAAPVLGIDAGMAKTLNLADTAAIELRYQAEAVPFRSEDEGAYYATIGDDAWLSAVEKFVQASVARLDTELRKHSKLVTAESLKAEILGKG